MAYLIDTDWIIQVLAGREQVVTTITDWPLNA
jgi:hypothetical protein